MVLLWARRVNVDGFPVSGISIIFFLAVPSSGLLSRQGGSHAFLRSLIQSTAASVQLCHVGG